MKKMLIFSLAGIAAAALVAHSQIDKPAAPAPATPPAPVAATAAEPPCENCPADAPVDVPVVAPAAPRKDLEIPDVVLLDQDGKEVHVHRDLIAGKTVAMNFVFTTCTTICPPMGAHFAELSKLVEKTGNDNLSLISVSLDPVVDTPERLKAWSTKFEGGPRWTLLTGPKPEVDSLLKGLEAFTANKIDHAPFVLIGNDAENEWVRMDGFGDPAKICAKMVEIDAKAAAESDVQAAAREFFTDVELTDQHGKPHKLYSDLIEDKTFVLHSFFTSCTEVCPVILAKVAQAAERHREHLGKDLHILSITVDPDTDTPEKLAKYAEGFEATEGWYFLTGSKAQVEFALQRVGHFTDDREKHSNLLHIMNMKTGLMERVSGFTPNLDLPEVVGKVLRDDG